MMVQFTRKMVFAHMQTSWSSLEEMAVPPFDLRVAIKLHICMKKNDMPSEGPLGMPGELRIGRTVSALLTESPSPLGPEKVRVYLFMAKLINLAQLTNIDYVIIVLM
jgi:hypothetical protein